MVREREREQERKGERGKEWVRAKLEDLAYQTRRGKFDRLVMCIHIDQTNTLEGFGVLVEERVAAAAGLWLGSSCGIEKS